MIQYESSSTNSVNSAGASDARTVALNYLGISLGTKNTKSLRREDIEEAFSSSFIDSVYVSVSAS